MKTKWKWILGVTLGFIVLWVTGGGLSQPAFIGIGDRGILDNGSQHIIVAADKQAFDEFTHAATIGDKMGWSQMMQQGKIFAVPKQTKVLVIDVGMLTKKVRVLEGEQQGRAGWIAMEFVKK